MEISYMFFINLLIQYIDWIAYATLGIVGGAYLFSWLSKYYLLPEVYLAETRGDRRPRLIGRKLKFAERDSSGFPDKLRSHDDIGAFMMIREGVLWSSNKKVVIPKDLEIKKKADKVIIYGAKGVKHDYDLGCLVPFSENVKANSPSETVIYNEIKRKLEKTDKEVTKATVASWRSKEWHNMYNSIPLDAETQSDDDSEIIKDIETDADSEKAKEMAKETKEKLEGKFSKEDKLDELGGGLDL